MTLIMIKLGGSLITDKEKARSFRSEVMRRIANEIQSARRQVPTMQVIIGHGSGSFGHFEASRYGTISGVETDQDWVGFSRVAVTAAALNQLVAEALIEAGIPILPIRTSSIAMANNGEIDSMSTNVFLAALESGLVPLVHGDVAFDSVRGGTIISTEKIFSFLVQLLTVEHIILLGDVDGVYDVERHVIPRIIPENFADVRASLGASKGVDVTGGMLTKVQNMLELVQHQSNLSVRIMSGLHPDLLLETLTSVANPGTVISSLANSNSL